MSFSVKHIVKEVTEKDLRKIRVTGFNEDFERFLKVLPEMIAGSIADNLYRYYDLHVVQGLGRINGQVYVAKKVRCKQLRCTDRFRVVFQINGEDLNIIEVYDKNDKECEDKQRILSYCQPPI